MSMLATASQTQCAAARPQPRGCAAGLLPYLLSLPALLVCIGILIPFVTAVYYSLQRYRLNLPYLRGFIWCRQLYRLPHRPRVLEHGPGLARSIPALTVVLELLLGLGIALLLQRPTRFNNVDLDRAAAAADDGAGDRRADVEADDQSRISGSCAISSAWSASPISNGPPTRRPRCSRSCWSTSGSTRPSS